MPSQLEVITSRSDLECPATYWILDENENRPKQRVYLTGIGEETAYGVEYESGSRIILDPLDKHISQNRLARPE